MTTVSVCKPTTRATWALLFWLTWPALLVCKPTTFVVTERGLYCRFDVENFYFKFDVDDFFLNFDEKNVMLSLISVSKQIWKFHGLNLKFFDHEASLTRS